jgi:hypothetical protein
MAVFTPQPLSAPLTDHAQTALRDLLRDKTQTSKLQKHLDEAVQLLTNVTGDINFRAYDRKQRWGADQKRRRLNNEQTDDTEQQAFEDFLEQVDAYTKQADTSMRNVIDDHIWLEDLPEALKKAVNGGGQSQTTSTQRTGHNQSPTPIQSTRHSDDEDDDRGNELLPPATTPHTLLTTALTLQSRTWHSKTLTERYAHNNDYKGWYSVLYESKTPEDKRPPIPNENLWFAAEEGRSTTLLSQTNSNGNGEDGDSDLEIESEQTRYRCPITLLPYVDPVTSNTCGHSYEKEAITDMLQTTTDTTPLPPDQLAELSQIRNRQERATRERILKARQPKQIKCPECTAPLLATDLRPNPALQRRVQRIVAAQERHNGATSDIEADEDDDDDGDVVRGTQRRPVGLGSSPMPSTRRSMMSVKGDILSRNLLKREQEWEWERERVRDSIVPNSQTQEVQETMPTELPSGTQRTLILDLDEDHDVDDEEEEEDEEEDEDEDDDEQEEEEE